MPAIQPQRVSGLVHALSGGACSSFDLSSGSSAIKEPAIEVAVPGKGKPPLDVSGRGGTVAVSGQDKVIKHHFLGIPIGTSRYENARLKAYGPGRGHGKKFLGEIDVDGSSGVIDIKNSLGQTVDYIYNDTNRLNSNGMWGAVPLDGKVTMPLGDGKNRTAATVTVTSEKGLLNQVSLKVGDNPAIVLKTHIKDNKFTTGSEFDTTKLYVARHNERIKRRAQYWRNILKRIGFNIPPNACVND